MIVATIVFFALLMLGVPVGFVMLGASVLYFIENPMMASIVACTNPVTRGSMNACARADLLEASCRRWLVPASRPIAIGPRSRCILRSATNRRQW